MKTKRDIRHILKGTAIMAAAPLIGLLFVIAIPYVVVAMFTGMVVAKLTHHTLPGAPKILVVRHS